jgi:hypothetical protein
VELGIFFILSIPTGLDSSVMVSKMDEVEEEDNNTRTSGFGIGLEIDSIPDFF